MDVTPCHCGIGAQHFETALWAHLPRLNVFFLNILVLEDETTWLSWKARHQLPCEQQHITEQQRPQVKLQFCICYPLHS